MVNPFRASIVLGTPGIGKSYAVVNNFIKQQIEKIVYHGIGLAAARRTQHDGRTEGINYIDPTLSLIHILTMLSSLATRQYDTNRP